MFYIKALLALLTSVLLCMANISGVVTDTAGVKIAGAIVKLEQGGQTDTTESDGSFILTAVTAGISNQCNQTLPNKLSVTIQHGLLYLNIPEKSTIDITIFNLTGKAISKMRQTMVAGIHFIALPQRESGIYLYKVKTGNNEFVLKSNSISGVTQGISTSMQMPSSNNTLAKQAKTVVAINDIIKTTKDGYLNYRAQVSNSDTSGITIKMIISTGTVTDADNNVYQTVKIGNQVWTVENLRTTKYNDGTSIPLLTTNFEWVMPTDAGYCYYNNTISLDSIKKFGALYDWYVVSPTNLKKIAPIGWHVPSDAEWDTLQNYLITNGYNYDGSTTVNKIAKALSAKTDWQISTESGTIGNILSTNNKSGFSALPGGYRYHNGRFNGQNGIEGWWSSTEGEDACVYYRYLSCDSNYLYRNSDSKYCGFPLRLVQD